HTQSAQHRSASESVSGHGTLLFIERIRTSGIRRGNVGRSRASSDLPELATAHDRLDRGADAVVLCLQLGLHLVEQGLVGKLDGAPERIAQQLATELPHECIAAVLQQVAFQAADTTDRPIVRAAGLRVDRPAAEVLLAPSAYRVVMLQGEAERVD